MIEYQLDAFSTTAGLNKGVVNKFKVQESISGIACRP